MQAKDKWNAIYAKADLANRPQPCSVLREHSYLLPQQGTALDIACGLGANAELLANAGLSTTAVDVSSVVIDAVADLAHPRITPRCCIVDEHFLKQSQYDVVVVSRFLDRSLCGAIQAALAPGGLLFYQTFVAAKTDTAAGPGNPDFLLSSNELLMLFAKMQVLAFSDLAMVGDSSHGLRNESFLVALKKADC